MYTHAHNTNLRLLEEDCLLRINATCQEADGHLSDVLPEYQRGLVDGERVEVHYAVQHAAALLLQLDPAANSPKVVAQLGRPRRLDAREDPLDLRGRHEFVLSLHTRDAWALT